MITIPASRVALVSGAATAAMIVIVMGASILLAGLELGFNSEVEFAFLEMPLYAFIVMPILAACLVGGVVAGSVRFGLFLSGARNITKQLMWVLVIANLVLIALYFSIPIETYAVVMNMPDMEATTLPAPSLMSQILVGAVVLVGVPALVAFAVGRYQGNANA